jgi:hypothetical protein
VLVGGGATAISLGAGGIQPIVVGHHGDVQQPSVFSVRHNWAVRSAAIGKV